MVYATLSKSIKILHVWKNKFNIWFHSVVSDCGVCFIQAAVESLVSHVCVCVWMLFQRLFLPDQTTVKETMTSCYDWHDTITFKYIKQEDKTSLSSFKKFDAPKCSTGEF